MGNLESHCEMIKVSECETQHCCMDNICGSKAAEAEQQKIKSATADVKEQHENCYFSFVIIMDV
jgi:hypothetical protein